MTLSININLSPSPLLVNTTTTVPANALLTEEGAPILNEDGNYILVD